MGDIMSDCSSCSGLSPIMQLQQQYMEKLRGNVADMNAQERLAEQQEQKVTEVKPAEITGMERTPLIANALMAQEMGA